LRPDLVLVEFGANDCGWHPLPPAATALALERLIDCIRAVHGADVAVLGLAVDNPHQPALQHTTETRAAIHAVAMNKGAHYVDLHRAIVAATANGDRWTDFHNGAQDCHPNDAGHAVWAEAVFNTLRAALQ
jgi:lysophospholipase L1-like esterase